MRELLSPAARDAFRAQFDCVLMLTWSNWRTEMRSNRYHYASRFARLAPVIFVQPDLPYRGYAFEATELSGLEILHVLADHHDGEQRELIDEALAERGVRRPLVWMWCFRYLDEMAHRWSPCKIFHATEDYWNDELHKLVPEWKHDLERVMELSHLLIGVSEGVVEAYLANTKFAGPTLANANGCDGRYWHDCMQRRPVPPPLRPVAFYQGNITRKIDFAMMLEVVRRMPDWDFWFAGPLIERQDEFAPLLELPNFRHFGKLHVDDLRDLAVQASCGLIPLVHEPWTIEQGSPLKAYEYVASGLPVVTVRHPFMEDDPRIYLFAETADEFVLQIRAATAIRWDDACLRARADIAARHDYDRRFETAVEKALSVMDQAAPLRGPARVLLVCGGAADLTTAIGWRRHSRHVLHAVAADGLQDIDLDAFDAVVLLQEALGEVHVPTVRRWPGYKVAVIPGEIDDLEASAEVERLCLQALLCLDRALPVHRPFLDSLAVGPAEALSALDDVLTRRILHAAEETRWTWRIPRELFVDPQGDFSTLTRRALPGILLTPREASIPIVDRVPEYTERRPSAGRAAGTRPLGFFDAVVFLGPCDRQWWTSLLSSLFDGLRFLHAASDAVSAAAIDGGLGVLTVSEPSQLREALQRLGVRRPLVVLEDFAGAGYLDALPYATSLLFLPHRRRLGERALADLLARVDLVICETEPDVESLCSHQSLSPERIAWAGGEIGDAILRAVWIPPAHVRLRIRLVHLGAAAVDGRAFLDRFASLSSHDVREETWHDDAPPDASSCDVLIMHMRADQPVPKVPVRTTQVLAVDDFGRRFACVEAATRPQAVVAEREPAAYESLPTSTLPWLTVLPVWYPRLSEPPPMAGRFFALGVEAWPADMATRLRVERVIAQARLAGLEVEVGASPRDCRAFLITRSTPLAEGAPVAPESLALPLAAYIAMGEGAVPIFLGTPPLGTEGCVHCVRDDLDDLDSVLERLRDVPALEEQARRGHQFLEARPEYQLDAMVRSFDTWLCARVPRGATLGV